MTEESSSQSGLGESDSGVQGPQRGSRHHNHNGQDQQQGGPQNLMKYNPGAFYPEWSTGSEQHLALMYIEGIEGSVRVPCGWIPLTCFTSSLRGYCTTGKSWMDFFRSWSETRTSLISKPTEKSSGELSVISRLKRPIPEVVIVVIYKVHPHSLGINQEDFGADSHDGGSNLNVNHSGSGDSLGSGGGGSRSGGRRGRCGRKRKCLCYPRCEGCTSRSRTNFSDWTGPRYGLVQQEFIYILRNVIFASAEMVVGMKCAPNNFSIGTGCFGSNGPVPSASDWDPQAGGLAPPAWKSSLRRENFPILSTDHGAPSVGKEQYYLQWSYAQFKYRVRNPYSECIYEQFDVTIPW